MIPMPGETQERWPLPDEVGEWGTEAEFHRRAPAAGHWVHWEDRLAQVLAGNYHAVLPLHVELSPTYLCNFGCPWCSCRSARGEWADVDAFHHEGSGPGVVAGRSKLEAIVDHLVEHRVEIMWAGGEPTMHPHLVPAIRRAAEGGVQQCLFTNGSLLTPTSCESLMEGPLAFIRVSLDAVSEQVHRDFHDYPVSRPFARRVLDGIEWLARLRAAGSPTEVGISLVVDERNLDDLEATADHLGGVVERHGPGSIDFVVVRPAMEHNGAEICREAGFAARLADRVGPGSRFAEQMRMAGVRVVVPGKGEDGTASFPRDDDLGCLAAGWFGEVNPRGELMLCSDRYGDPDYAIGNVATTPLTQLWSSPRRLDVLNQVAVNRCYQQRCPAGSRGRSLNRAMRQVEMLRRAGRLDDVTRWANELREKLPAPPHSFYV